MARIGLVACSKTKLARPSAARELYTSPLFRAAANYCDRVYDRWWILSALHGVLGIYARIEPYDLTLAAMPLADRRAWTERVRGELAAVTTSEDTLYVHAGDLYRYWIPDWGRTRVEVPLAGLGIGRQLAWYAARRPWPPQPRT